jgi:hypothetical protein
VSTGFRPDRSIKIRPDRTNDALVWPDLTDGPKVSSLGEYFATFDLVFADVVEGHKWLPATPSGDEGRWRVTLNFDTRTEKGGRGHH